MRTRLMLAAALAAVGGLILAPACEDTALIAPTGGSIVLSASPTVVRLDSEVGPSSGPSTISAQVFDADGFALPGVSVFFSTTGGSVGSAPPGESARPVETNSNGVAVDVLTVGLNDGQSVTVTARSGTLSEEVEVGIVDLAFNTRPSAAIAATPSNQAPAGSSVIFNGTGNDLEGNRITCYEWVINSSEPIDNPVAPCSPPSNRCERDRRVSSSITRLYTVEQTLAVVLRVSDEPGINCSPTANLDPSLFGTDATLSYRIVCADTSAPIAEAGDPQTVSLGGTNSVAVQLDGSASADPQSGISSYRWECRNPPLNETPSGAQVTCNYSSAGTFTPRLTVTNGCNLTATDTVTITVSP